ncbi:hypothetical protein EDD86DRAFT_19865 [Gorgonomyces haynaldii]|nr:hypothetical protein EDD86DRAFT_19865 [Gorgonomyces haynaldii]
MTAVIHFETCNKGRMASSPIWCHFHSKSTHFQYGMLFPVALAVDPTAYSAAIYGWANLKLAETYYNFTSKSSVNTLQHTRTLAGPESTIPVTNSDTLYSSAFLDLRQDAIAIQVPRIEDRYYMHQFLDFDTNVIGSASPRNHPIGSYNLTIVHGAVQQLPENAIVFNSSTPIVWYLGRLLVQNQSDVQTVHKLQDQFKITPLRTLLFNEVVDPLPIAVPPVNPQDDLTVYRVLAWSLGLNGYPASVKQLVDSWTPLGITPGSFTGSATLNLTQASKQAQSDAESLVDQSEGLVTNNKWRTVTSLGNFGTDYLLRAKIAQSYIGANLPQDAVYYLGLFDNWNLFLNGKGQYKITFGQIPVKGFWSISAYSLATKLFVKNEYGIYSVNSVNSVSTDGKTTVYLSHVPRNQTNWLPVPKENFILVFRFYYPSQEILNNTFVLPSIQRQ